MFKIKQKPKKKPDCATLDKLDPHPIWAWLVLGWKTSRCCNLQPPYRGTFQHFHLLDPSLGTVNSEGWVSKAISLKR